MGNYVDSNAGTGESVRYTARVTLWKYSFYFLVGGLLILGSLLILIRLLFTGSDPPPPAETYAVGFVLLFAISIFVWPFIARKSTELVITDKRLISKYGVVSTHSIEIRFNKIETVRVTQGLVGKIFNYGDIVVTGTGSTFDPIRRIVNPMGFRAALNEALELNQPGGA
jgi:uncharacterized membrane protein YdbT with pleckstrin-like domain